MAKAVKLHLILNAMHPDDVSLEIVEPWPAFLSRSAALHAASPVWVTVPVCLVDGSHVPSKVVDSLEAR